MYGIIISLSLFSLDILTTHIPVICCDLSVAFVFVKISTLLFFPLSPQLCCHMLDSPILGAIPYIFHPIPFEPYCPTLFFGLSLFTVGHF